MINDLTGGSWREGGIQRKFRARLCNSSRTFEATMRAIKTTVGNMKEQIEAQRSSMYRLSWKTGLLFSLSSDIMSTIIASISELENLTKGLKPTEAESTQNSDASLKKRKKRFNLMRGASGTTFTGALKTSFGYSSNPHAGLTLEGTLPAGITPTQDNSITTRALMFQVGIFLKKQSQCGSVGDEEVNLERSQTWQEFLKRRARSNSSRVTLEIPASL